jgi:hypothetical protein
LFAAIASRPVTSTSTSDGTTSHFVIARMPPRIAAYSTRESRDAVATSTTQAAIEPIRPIAPISCSAFRILAIMAFIESQAARQRKTAQ